MDLDTVLAIVQRIRAAVAGKGRPEAVLEVCHRCGHLGREAGFVDHQSKVRYGASQPAHTQIEKQHQGDTHSQRRSQPRSALITSRSTETAFAQYLQRLTRPHGQLLKRAARDQAKGQIVPSERDDLEFPPPKVDRIKLLTKKPLHVLTRQEGQNAKEQSLSQQVPKECVQVVLQAGLQLQRNVRRLFKGGR